jgi:hypothetical protein
MTGTKYDPLGGYLRLARAAEHIDEEASHILAFHAALEREIDLILMKLLPRSERLGSIGFANKIKILDAAWIASDEAAQNLCAVLVQFNELRNAVAHGNRDRLEGCRKSLIDAYHAIDDEASDKMPIGAIAQGICAFMGDGPKPAHLKRVFGGLENVLSVFPGIDDRTKI